MTFLDVDSCIGGWLHSLQYASWQHMDESINQLVARCVESVDEPFQIGNSCTLLE